VNFFSFFAHAKNFSRTISQKNLIMGIIFVKLDFEETADILTTCLHQLKMVELHHME